MIARLTDLLLYTGGTVCPAFNSPAKIMICRKKTDYAIIFVLKILIQCDFVTDYKGKHIGFVHAIRACDYNRGHTRCARVAVSFSNTFCLSWTRFVATIWPYVQCVACHGMRHAASPTIRAPRTPNLEPRAYFFSSGNLLGNSRWILGRFRARIMKNIPIRMNGRLSA